MSVHYKFKSEKQFATVSFDGVHISVADLKKEISHQKNFGKCEFGLLIKNAQTDEGMLKLAKSIVDLRCNK